MVGYIDETGVTVVKEENIMINSPLSDCKISALSCVVPGFGVLYKFFLFQFSTQEVEDMISNLKICVIPTVPIFFIHLPAVQFIYKNNQ